MAISGFSQLKEFKNGEVASADEVNANFAYLAQKISELETKNTNSDSLIVILSESGTAQNILMAKLSDSISILKDEVALTKDLTSTDLLPIGTIIPSMLDSSALPGFGTTWTLADGRIASAEYFSVTGIGTVPDFRGTFLRGMDLGSGRDVDGVGREVGSYQGDATSEPNSVFLANYSGEHFHATGYEDTAIPGKFGKVETGLRAGRYDHGDGASATGTSSPKTSTVGDHRHTIVGGDIETRPINNSVYYYIKIK